MIRRGYFPKIRQVIQSLPPNLVLSVWITSILFVTYSSLKPGIDFPLNFWNADRIYHMVAYGWLAFLSLWVFKERKTAVVVMFIPRVNGRSSKQDSIGSITRRISWKPGHMLKVLPTSAEPSLLLSWNAWRKIAITVWPA
jgi:hypothetical protein